MTGFIEGRGEGNTREEAESKALDELAKQIQVKIKTKTLFSDHSENGESTILYEIDIESATNIVLTGAKKIKEEKILKTYYCLYSYDNRTLTAKILNSNIETNNKNWIAKSNKNSKTFKHSLPFSQFLESHNLVNGFYLYNKNNIWNVTIEDLVFPVSFNELSNNFFCVGGVGNIEILQGSLYGSPVIGQTRNELKENQFFSFLITPPISGYINLYYIDNTGVVIKLIDDKEVRKDNILNYPDPEMYPEGIICNSAANLNHSTDMVLAIYSLTTLEETYNYNQISEGSLTRIDDAYSHIIDMLNNLEELLWCSRIIHIIGDN